MMIFLALKERLKEFYGRYATLVNGAVKFLYSMSAVTLLNGNIGYQTELTSMVAMLAIAVISAFLPYGAIGFLLGIVMLAHIYAVPWNCTDHGCGPDHSDPAVLWLSAR
ncbi:hypothetical protein [Clostridium sp. OF09-36]|uniref:hypothetical protein n=1 Tax=Clostridium sp. OF09-36 TaxID=2292310 RepID=UPI001FAA351E|nr:hypothetical protein [Clostridium sp. OF09-36]